MTTAIRKSRGEARTRMLRETNGVPDSYLTTGAAGAYLGVSHAAVWLAYQEGRLQGEKFGKLACFTREQLDAYDARRRAKGMLRPALTHTSLMQQAEAPEVVQELPQDGQAQAQDAHAAQEQSVPCSVVQTRYSWSDVQAMALVGKMKKLALSGGGLLYLAYDVDLFTLSERERALLFALIDAIQQFEAEQA